MKNALGKGKRNGKKIFWRNKIKKVFITIKSNYKQISFSSQTNINQQSQMLF